MVDIQTAKQKVEQAKQAIAQRREQISVVEGKLQQAKKSLPDITTQQALRGQRLGQGLKGRETRRKIKRVGEEIKEKRKKIDVYKKELDVYASEVVKQEQAIKKVEKAIAAQAALKRDYEIAKKYATKNLPRSQLANDRQKQFYDDIKEGLDAQKRLAEQSKAIREATGLTTLQFSKLSTGELEQLPTEKLQILEKAGIIKLDKIDTSRLDRKTNLELQDFNQMSIDVERSSRKLFGGELLPLVSASSDVSRITGMAVKDRTITRKIKDVSLGISGYEAPRVNITTETGKFVSAYPLGTGGTAIITPLGLSEQEKIRELKYKTSLRGMAESALSLGAKISGKIGEGVGYVTTIKGVPDIFEKQLGFPSEIRVGSLIRKGREFLPAVGEYGAGKITKGIELFKGKYHKLTDTRLPEGYRGVVTEAKPVPVLKGRHYAEKLGGMFERTVITAARYAPEAAAYYFGGGYMLGADIITGSEKLRTHEEDYKKEIDKRYIIYTKQLGAGEKPLTKREFEEIVGKDIKEQMQRNILFDIGVPLIFASSYGIKRGIKAISKIEPEFQVFVKEPRTSVELVGEPTRQFLTGKAVITEYPLLSTGQRIEAGRRTIIRTKRPKILSKLLGGDEVIYTGSYRLDKEGYEKSLKMLKKQGFTEAQARNLLREIRPKVTEDIFSGLGQVVESEEGLKLVIKGTKKSIPIKTTVEGVETRLGRGEFRVITSTGEPLRMEGIGEGLFRFRQVEKKAFLDIGKPTSEYGKEGVIRWAKKQLQRKDLIPYSKVSQAGKTETTYDIITGSRLLKEGEIPVGKLQVGDISLLKMKEVEIYKEASALRQTIPKKRGVSFGESMVIVEKGRPKVIYDLDEVFGVRELKGFKGRGKPSSKQFFQQLYLQEGKAGLASGLLEITKPKVVLPKKPTITGKSVLEKPVTRAGILPLVSAQVQEPRMKPSIYYGKGMYERTESYGVAPKEALDKLQPSLLGIKPIQALRGQRLGQGLKLRQLEKVKPTQIEAQIPKQKSLLKKILGLKQKQVQRVVQKHAKITTTPIQPQRPKKPIIKPKPLSSMTKEEKELKTISALDKFKVFVRKLGKDVELGEFATLGEAKKKLKQELLGTLRAGGFVTKGGKKIKLDLGFGFRPSKVDPFRIVQKKTMRFGTKSEVKEAQLFRKKKGRKLKFF